MEIRTRQNIKWDTSSRNGITEDYDFVERLRNEYKIIAGGVGTLKTISKQNKLMTYPFLLNQYEVKYLIEKYIIFK
jgi:hypothetical protein